MNSNIDIPVEKLNEPGNIWIRPQNKQFRYSTNADEAVSWLIPISTYTVSKEVKFGQPVSLSNYSQEHSISKNGVREQTIMPTNSIQNESCIGIAIEYGKANSKVHVQNNGELVYELSKKDNSKYWIPSYHKDSNKNFVFDWTDSDVGSTVYIKADGTYTLNVDDVSGGNIMSIGKLVYAPKATETKLAQQKIIIHLQAGGDDRGVKDTAQFTIQMSSKITTKTIESNYDKILFVKINKEGYGEFIFTDDAITQDIDASPVGAIVVKSENGVCSLNNYIGQKITLIRMGLVSGNFGFNEGNIGKIGLLNDGNVSFKSAKDYNIKVGIFKSITSGLQDFLIDCRYPVESSKSSEKVGTIKPVFGPNDSPLLDVGYALVDDNIHRVSFIKNDSVDTSRIDWSDLISNCYSKDIFEFGRKVNGQYVFSRYLEDLNGKSWSPDILDTDTTLGIFNAETFFKFRNLFYTIKDTNGNDTYAACQIKYNAESLNTNEECIWPEESYKITLKATSDKESYVLGGKGANSTLFCNISRLVAVGNYMDGDGSNIETYDITVKVQSTGQLLSPGFYQNKDGKWCGFEWTLYSNNGLTYLYMSTIPAGIDAKDCNGICVTQFGKKMATTDAAETLIVTVRRRPTMYNAVYLNQYPVNNPWTPYIDGNTGNLITENAIYFGSPSKLLSQNKTGEEDGSTSGLSLNEAGRNGKIELTTEDSGKTITLATQVRGSTNTPKFKDKKQVIKSDGSIANSIEWEYDFSNMVTSLNAYLAPIIISRDSNKNNVSLINLNYINGTNQVSTSDFEEYLHGKDLSALEILDSYVFRNIKYANNTATEKSTISIVVNDDPDSVKYIFTDLGEDLIANRYSINADNLQEYKNLLYVDNKYINYMSLIGMIGIANKEAYNRILRLERIVHGDDFNSHVDTSSEYTDTSIDYISNIGLLRASGYFKKSLALVETGDFEEKDLDNAYFPHSNKYISIIDRLVIENFYEYTSLEALYDCYKDYESKDFNERFNFVKEQTSIKGSNIARLNFLYKDLDLSEYIYHINDYFKYLDSENKYEIKEGTSYKGNFISADKIVFKKNTIGYGSKCKSKISYGYYGLKVDDNPTKTIYELYDGDFDSNLVFYQNTGTRDYIIADVVAETFEKNKYYIKKEVESTYMGYPFMWPLYNDSAFNEIDFEYNFFSKKTYGLDDSAALYDNSEDGILSTFSSQSLEGFTFDTISKLSFLYSCFDKNHTFDAKMTLFLPFIIDDYSTDYKYELKRLSQAKSIKAENNATYSAFVMRDNKISELGSLYFDAFRHMFFESNTLSSTATSIANYENNYINTWQRRYIDEKHNANGVKTSKSSKIYINIGQEVYEYSIPEYEETYKKVIYLLTQGKLYSLKNTLVNNPNKARKAYKEFFQKDYIKSIDISTTSGLTAAIDSVTNYIHNTISESDLKILAKFSITPQTSGPNNNFIRAGSYSTLISEVKSLRAIETVTEAEVQRLFKLFENYVNRGSGTVDSINGDNAFSIAEKIEFDLNTYDSYNVSTIVNDLYWNETQISTSSEDCPHLKTIRKPTFKQTGRITTKSQFTVFNVVFESKTYKRAISGCSQCVTDEQAIANQYKNILLKVSGIPELEDNSLGTYSVSVTNTSFAEQEVAELSKNNKDDYNTLSSYYNDNFSFSDGTQHEDDYAIPEIFNKTIFLARAKYLLDLGYTTKEITSYYDIYFSEEEQSSSKDSVTWSDYSLIDYARAAAYGSRNIVFYSKKAYSAFNNISSSQITFSSTDDIKTGLADSNNLVDAYNNSRLKVVWPKEINTRGQAQESLTFTKNNINKFINRTLSDSTSGNGDLGIINIKPNSTSRLSSMDENNLPDIKVSELVDLLKGDEEICKKCNIDPVVIKDFNIDTNSLEVTIKDFSLPVINIGEKLISLYEIYALQYGQIKDRDNDIAGPLPESNIYISQPVLTASSQNILVYDLIQQGLTYGEAKRFVYDILYGGENIFGGFKLNPELEHTYGLLNDSYYGVPRKINDQFHGSKLEGLVLHRCTESEKAIADFTLLELYQYNNIDKMLLADSDIGYEASMKRISIVKDYIELFFTHSDKLFKDISIIDKKEFIEIKGTTYIDDCVDKDKTNQALLDLRDSIDTEAKITKPTEFKAPDDIEPLYSVSDLGSVSVSVETALNNMIDKIIDEVNSALSRCSIVESGDSYRFNASSISDKNTIKDQINNIVNSDIESAISTVDCRPILSGMDDIINANIVKYINAYLGQSRWDISIDKTIENFNLAENKAFNIEAFNPAYERNEETHTGKQYSSYIYKDFIPEYGYLHTKPADGLSIQKKVNVYETSEGSFHNEVKTIIKPHALTGSSFQKEAFIGDKIELKEGAFLRGEQLPLPIVSLDISPDMQLQSQRLGYQPEGTKYYSSYYDTTSYKNINAKYIDIVGSFPQIIIDGVTYSIVSVKKIIATGEAFDKLPNGLKIIPTVDVGFNINYVDDSGDNTVTKSRSGSLSFEGPKIYRNYIYNVTIKPMDNETDFILFNGNKLDITRNESVIESHVRKTNASISVLDLNNITSANKSRKVAIDDDFIRDIVENSDLFIISDVDGELDKNALTVNVQEESYNSYSPNATVKHVSEVGYTIKY